MILFTKRRACEGLGIYPLNIALRLQGDCFDMTVEQGWLTCVRGAAAYARDRKVREA